MWNTRTVAVTCLTALLTLTAPFARAASDVWQLEKDAQGIQLYTREVPGQVLKNFRGIMLVEAPLAQVAATLADVPAMPEWFFLLEESRFIKGEHVEDSYIYMAMKGIWPVSPRDAVAHVLVRQDPITLTIHVNVESEDGIQARRKGYVRIPRLVAAWKLRPVGTTQTEVEIEGSADPGGMIPVPLANYLVTTLPEQTLKKMRTHIARPEYRDLKTIYAKNPKLRELADKMKFPGLASTAP